ncbi:MAG: hypothetical protein WBG42_04380 [Cryomorphaceae bacterium]
MKQILTNLLLVFSPFCVFSQTVADTSFLFEKAGDEFYEFFWQNQLDISSDSTFYLLQTSDPIRKLELVDSSDKIIWKSEAIDSKWKVPVSIIRENNYQIRMHGERGVTEAVWHP